MARVGTGRQRREAVLEALEKADPQRYAELVEMRHYDPVHYRREIARAARKLAMFAPPNGARIAEGEPTPGRETDPTLRVGPPPEEAPSPANAAPRAPRPPAAAPPPAALPDAKAPGRKPKKTKES